MGVEQYDYLLSHMYGDYMTPPPAGTEFQHNIHYMNLEMPYKEYNTQNIERSKNQKPKTKN